MSELLRQCSLWAVLLTVAAYQAGLFLKKKTKLGICNPILIAAVLIIAFLLVSKVPNQDYQAGMKSISWLLTPCTVSLGIPLYTQLQKLRNDLPAILVGVLSGTAVSLGSVIVLCRVFSLEGMLAASLLPKSITTAMAIPLSEGSGGLVPLTTSAVILTGILGGVMGEGLSKLFRLRSPIAQGVAFGTASHVIGTSRATELSELSGAVGSLSLVAAGIVTAIVYPLVLPLI